MSWKTAVKSLASFLLVAIPAAGDELIRNAAEGTCVAGPETLCLGGGQFSVEVDWQDDDLVTGRGQVLGLGGDDWGLFYLDDSRYLELLVRVADACAVNGHYWVFLAGLSDYEQTVTVTDTVGASVVQYLNLPGSFLTVTDTSAIPCPSASGATPSGGSEGVPVMTLVNGRFLVELEWEDFAMNTGFGQPITATSYSGVFSTADPSTPDVAVKLVDGSADNGFFQLTWAGATNLGLALRVTDLCSGNVRTYTNPVGMTAATTVDTTAFATDACDVFSDGFESGNTSAWSASVP